MGKLGIDLSEKRIEGKPESVVIVRLSNYLDNDSFTELQTIMNERIAQGDRKFLLNLEDLTYVSSAGLGVFVSVLQRLKDDGGVLRLCSVPSAIMKVMKILGLHSVLPIDPNEKVSLKTFGA